MSKNFSKLLKTIIEKWEEPFLSEADFQHTLAWELHGKSPDSRIILEYPEEIDGKRNYYDIYFSSVEYGTHLIELKYRTKKDSIEKCGRSFTLRNQSAVDLGCFHFWRDVVRMEETAIEGMNEKYCIFLTNDQMYYGKKEKKNDVKNTGAKKPDNEAKKTASYENFKIRNGMVRSKTLKWDCEENNKKSWMSPEKLTLKNEYTCKWEPCHLKSENCKPEDDNPWQYLILEIPPPKMPLPTKNCP